MSKTLRNKKPVTPRRIREQDLPRDSGRAFGTLRSELINTFRNCRTRTSRMLELRELLTFMVEQTEQYVQEDFEFQLHNMMVEIDSYTEQAKLDAFAKTRYGVELDGREKLETMKEKLATIVQDSVIYHKTILIKDLEKVDLSAELAKKKAQEAAQATSEQLAKDAVAKAAAPQVEQKAEPQAEPKATAPSTTAPNTPTKETK